LKIGQILPRLPRPINACWILTCASSVMAAFQRQESLAHHSGVEYIVHFNKAAVYFVLILFIFVLILFILHHSTGSQGIGKTAERTVLKVRRAPAWQFESSRRKQGVTARQRAAGRGGAAAGQVRRRSRPELRPAFPPRPPRRRRRRPAWIDPDRRQARSAAHPRAPTAPPPPFAPPQDPR
jgi:hypothetical protein